jgi:hypothetical protein
MSNEEPSSLGYAQIAELTGLTRATLRSYRAKGLLPEPDDTSVPDRPRWSAETIARWRLQRAESPGMGNRTGPRGRPPRRAGAE